MGCLCWLLVLKRRKKGRTRLKLSYDERRVDCPPSLMLALLLLRLVEE